MGVYRRFGAKFSYVKNRIIKIDKKITDGRETALIEKFLHRLRTAILHRINNPFKEVNLNISTFFDPRFKDRYIEPSLIYWSNNIKLIKFYEDISKNHPELFMEFSIDEIQKANNNLKRIKRDEHEEEFGEISNYQIC